MPDLITSVSGNRFENPLPVLEQVSSHDEDRGPSVWILPIAALVAAGYFGWQRSHANDAGRAENAQKSATLAQAAAVPVTIAPVVKTDFPVYLSGLGTVQGFNTVLVRTRVDGQIDQIAFKEGQQVKQGDVLVQIDPRPYPGRARSGQGQEGAGPGQPRQRQSGSAALHHARRIRNPPADRYPAFHRGAIDRAARSRRRRDFQRPDPVRLHHGQGADLRRRRPASGRRRQHRQCRHPDRHRNDRADRADCRDLHRTGRPAALHQ